MSIERRRLVLDTNCLRGLSETTLCTLVEHGARLSVSMIALEESLARSHREGSVSILRARVRKLTPFVDATTPLTPVGTPLFHSLGASFGPERDEAYAAYNRLLPLRWKFLSEVADDAQWRHEAEVLNESIDANAATVSAVAEAMRGLPRSEVSISKLRGATLEYLGKTLSLEHGVQERLHAYGACLAQMIHGAAAATPATNDSEDLQLLEHLADDVIVLTSDYRFITRVDRTGSFQAPYVRTPDEVLLLDLPDGPPWGRNARRALRLHVPRDRAALQRLTDYVTNESRSEQASSRIFAK